MEKKIVKENKSINIAKGIGILLMVAGHSGMPNMPVHFIYAFHMPLFFIISGYCFKEKYISEPWTFVRKRFKGLYIPYVKYMLLFILLHNVFAHLHFYEETYTLRDYTRCAFYTITTMGGSEGLLGGYWFLTQLLLCSLIGYIFFRWGNLWTYIGGGIFLFAAFAASSFHVAINHCPINDVTFKATFFFLIGRVIKFKGITMKLVPALIGILMVFGFSIYSQTGIWGVSSYLWFAYSIFAIVGTLSVLTFSHYISENWSIVSEFLNWTGKHTLEILTWHFLGFKIVSYLLIVNKGLSINHLEAFPVMTDFSKEEWWILYFLGGTLFSFFIIKINLMYSKVRTKWV